MKRSFELSEYYLKNSVKTILQFRQLMCTFVLMKANLLLIVATLILAFSSCNKISEDLQRDLIISPDSMSFSIPPMIANGDSIVIDNLPATVNIADSIKKETVDEFNADHIKAVRLSNFTIDLVRHKNDTINNRSNFNSIDFVKANLNNGTQKDNLASVTNSSSLDVFTAKLTLNQVMETSTLKTYLSNGTLRYSLIIKPRKSTIDTIKAKIGTSYTLTLVK